MEDAQHGYSESWREQVRLQEELVMKEKSSSRQSDSKYARDGKNEKRSRTTIWRNLSAKIKRKSWDNTKAHFSVTRDARTNEFCEWFRRMSRSGIKSQWQIDLRSKSTSNACKLSFHAEPRQALATWHVEYIWITGNRLWLSIFFVWFIPRSSSRNSLLYNTKRTRISSTSNRDRDSFCKRWETKKRHNSNADICRKGRRPWVLQYRWNYRRTTWSDSKDSKYRNCNLTNSMHPLHSDVWKIRFKNQVTTCYDCPSEAKLRIKEVEMVDSLKEFKSLRSIAGKKFPKFEELDARIASALKKIIQNSHVKKKVSFE